MFDFDPFDLDFHGDVDGIDLLRFDYLMRHELGHDEDEDEEERERGDDEIACKF